MSSVGSIPQLKLFPLYTGGPVIQPRGAGPNALTADSAFRLGGNNFLPAFNVNGGGPIVNPLAQDTFLRINKDNSLSRQPISAANNFNTPLALDPTRVNGLKVAPVPAVAPNNPRKYQEYLESLGVSDLNSAELLSPNNSFNMRWLGLTVTTDANGDVDKLSVKPSLQSSMPQFGSKNDPNYLLLNRAEISERAILKSANSQPAAPKVQTTNPADAAKKAAQKALLGNQNLKGLQQPLGLLGVKQSVLNPDLNALREQAKNNPILERLLQLQPKDNGLSTTGYQANLDAEESRKLAAVNAKYDVDAGNRITNDRSRADMISLIAGAKEMHDTSALTLARQRDGQIPMVPSLPAQPKSNVELGAGLSAGNDNSFGAGVADSMDKKGKGGYIPFSMSHSGHNPFAGFESGAGSPGGNPFKGTGTGAGQQQQQGRRFGLTA